jgi:serine-type D-Ala-D-Ala carboxypeptidase (penicillin-binding protein 5/6)
MVRSFHPSILRFCSVLFTVLFFAVGTAHGQAIETKAKQAILLDASSGSILFQKNADERIPPASLAKLMTLEAVFNGIGSGTLSTTNAYKVSEDSWRRGGAPSGTASMFAALNSSIALGDLVRGAAIPVANDACLIMAEGISGSETAFVEVMNARAKSLGLKNSVFINSTGLPQDGQTTTMRDMAFLVRHMFEAYPEQMTVFSEPDFTWNKITQRNRNPLIGNFEGVNGVGLGFTKDMGYSIVVSAKRNDLHIVMALAGLESEKDRQEEARRILQWAYSSIDTFPVYPQGDVLGKASVFGGSTLSVPVIAKNDVKLLVELGADLNLKARIVYAGPLIAPVVKDQLVGKLLISMNDVVILETPVFAAESVDRGTITQRAYSGAKELVTGWMRSF